MSKSQSDIVSKRMITSTDDLLKAVEDDLSKYLREREENRRAKITSKKSQTPGFYKNILTYEDKNEIIIQLGSIVTHIQEIVELQKTILEKIML